MEPENYPKVEDKKDDDFNVHEKGIEAIETICHLTQSRFKIEYIPLKYGDINPLSWVITFKTEQFKGNNFINVLHDAMKFAIKFIPKEDEK